MSLTHKFTALAALWFLAALAAGAEPNPELRDFAVRAWTSADGLPDASVTAIIQTQDGYLWIGTGAGLYRFDGFKFTPTPLPRSGTNGPAAVTALCEDTGGALWVGTRDQGVFRRENDAAASHIGTADGLSDSWVTSLAVDHQKRMWIGTREGVDVFDHGRVRAFTTKEGLQTNWVLAVHAAKSGTVWITTANGMCRFARGRLAAYHFPVGDTEGGGDFFQAYEDRQGNLWAFCSTYVVNLAGEKRINYFQGDKSAATRIWSLCEGASGRLWLGASGRGVFCFDGTHFQPVTLNEGRWPNDVQTICEDREGNLWLGISGVGLVQLRQQTYSISAKNLGLPSGPAACAVADAAGREYAAMDSGGVFAGAGDHFEPVNPGDRAFANDAVISLCVAADGTLWTGTTGSGLCHIHNGRAAAYTTANGLGDDCVTALAAAADGAVWLGARSGAVQRVSPEGNVAPAAPGGFADGPVTSILAARDGGVWAGSAAGGLFHAAADDPRLEKITLPASLAGKAVMGLCESARHGLWIASDGGGIGWVNGEERRAWDERDGLPGNVVWGAAMDEDGGLWLATPKGLCRIDGDSLRLAQTGAYPLRAKVVFDTDPTTPRATRFGGPRAFQVSASRLIFALNSGLAAVDVQGHEAGKPPPEVHIEAMLVNNRPVDLSPRAPNAPAPTTPSDPQKLEFRFTGLSFAAPEKVRFRHKLEGYDADWVEGTARQALYAPLPPANYQFRVNACNADGVWNEKPTSLAFIIPAPFWRTPWGVACFAVAATLAGAAVVRAISHRRLRERLHGMRQQQVMERERMRIAQNMHDEIGSKLTKISYLSERAKTELRDAGAPVGKVDSIAATSRELLMALDEIVWAVNPKNDSLEHLAAYFCQYAREYFQDTAVECDVRAQTNLPHVEMSAETRHNLFLAFEESLNNVLKHSKATQLAVAITAEDGALRIRVQDNGGGFDPGALPGKATGGNGLRNIRQRLAEIGGAATVESQPGRGATVCLSAPLASGKLKIQ